MTQRLEIRREMVRRSIALNPAVVEIQRTVKEDDGAGGVTTSTETLDPQEVRIFISTDRIAVDTGGEGGLVHISRYGLLAPHDADLQRGDSFEHEGRTYRVRSVRAVRFQGETVSFQAELEEVT